MKQKERLYIHITVWNVIKILLTVGLAVFCFGVWPGYLIHTYQNTASYPATIEQSRWLTAEDVIQQHFSPAGSRISRIRIAVLFDEGAAADNSLIFTLWDETGKSVCCREILFSQLEDGGFFYVPIHKKLQIDHEYVWTLTLSEGSELQYALLITGDTGNDTIENISLSINGNNTQMNALSQFEYYAHFDKVEIIGSFWVEGFIIWLLLLEVTDRANNLFERKKSNGESKSIEKI